MSEEAQKPLPCPECGQQADWMGFAEAMQDEAGATVPAANWYSCPEGHVFSVPA
jgi:hypothetical protein